MPLITGLIVVTMHLTIGLILAPFTGGASLAAAFTAINIDMTYRGRRSKARRRRRR